MVKRVFKAVLLAGLIAVARIAAACSSKDGSGTASASAAGGSAALTVKDFAFDPSSVSGASGGDHDTLTTEGAVVHSLHDGRRPCQSGHRAMGVVVQ